MGIDKVGLSDADINFSSEQSEQTEKPKPGEAFAQAIENNFDTVINEVAHKPGVDSEFAIQNELAEFERGKKSFLREVGDFRGANPSTLLNYGPDKNSDLIDRLAALQSAQMQGYDKSPEKRVTEWLTFNAINVGIAEKVRQDRTIKDINGLHPFTVDEVTRQEAVQLSTMGDIRGKAETKKVIETAMKLTGVDRITDELSLDDPRMEVYLRYLSPNAAQRTAAESAHRKGESKYYATRIPGLIIGTDMSGAGEGSISGHYIFADKRG